MKTKFYATPIGALQARFTDTNTLWRLGYYTSDCAAAPGTTQDAVSEELDNFFSRRTQRFSIPTTDIDSYTEATPLQRDVWRALQNIPYGTTISYAELARRSGHPRAVRAVASAVGKNPLSIIIPCHRVIRSDGNLGNYALRSLGPRGRSIKETLLSMEQSLDTNKGYGII